MTSLNLTTPAIQKVDGAGRRDAPPLPILNQKCSHIYDPQSHEDVCVACGLAWPNGHIVRDIGEETKTQSPNSAVTFCTKPDLGTDQATTIKALRGPKLGGSLHRINQRIAKGEALQENGRIDQSELRRIQSEENVIGPATVHWLIQSDRIENEGNLLTILEDGQRIITNAFQNWPGYTPSSLQFKSLGDQANKLLRKYAKQLLREKIRDLAFLALEDTVGVRSLKLKTKQRKKRIVE
jgi:hypothetical protein